jgi:hypothetical protein
MKLFAIEILRKDGKPYKKRRWYHTAYITYTAYDGLRVGSDADAQLSKEKAELLAQSPCRVVWFDLTEVEK